MSQDDFLDGLKGDWQSRTADPASLAQAVQSGEAKLRQQKLGRLASLAAYFLLMIAFFAASRMLESVLFHLGAVAFLVAFILSGAEFVFLRRVTGADFMADADTLLKKAERQAQSAVMLAQGSLAAAMLLGLCAIFAAAFAFTGMAEPIHAGLLAITWAVVGGALTVRQRRISTQAQAELEQVQALRMDSEQEEQ